MNNQNNGNDLDFDENGTTVLTDEDINFARGTTPNQPQELTQPENDPFSNPEYENPSDSAQSNVNVNQNNPYSNPKMPPPKKYNTKRKKWLLPVIIAVAVFIVGFAVFFGAYYIPKNIKYNKAVAEFRNENYSDAIVMFREIEGFRDSKEKIYYCYTMSGDVLEQEQKYSLAKQQYEESYQYAQTDEQKSNSEHKVKTLGNKELFKTAYDSCQGSSCIDLSIDGLRLDVKIPNNNNKKAGINCFTIAIDKLGLLNNYTGDVFGEAVSSFKQGQEYDKQIGDIHVHAVYSSLTGSTFTFTTE